nr:MAG TPA: hypothetical protein [Caudoviricetes sp.]
MQFSYELPILSYRVETISSPSALSVKGKAFLPPIACGFTLISEIVVESLI